MTPAIMTHEVGSKVRLRLEVLLLNIADCTKPTLRPPHKPAIPRTTGVSYPIALAAPS